MGKLRLMLIWRAIRSNLKAEDGRHPFDFHPGSKVSFYCCAMFHFCYVEILVIGFTLAYFMRAKLSTFEVYIDPLVCVQVI